jgi:DNA gyrase/topoisomerase IV subunit A
MTAPISRERILPRLLDEEIKESFINYSMSVIVSRALPGRARRAQARCSGACCSR